MRRVVAGSLWVAVLAVVAAVAWTRVVDSYQQDGTLTLASLSAPLRVVADLGDPDKVMAVLTGGASGRQFDAHLKDQTGAWLSGEPSYWWFSDAAIAKHGTSELILAPSAPARPL